MQKFIFLSNEELQSLKVKGSASVLIDKDTSASEAYMPDKCTIYFEVDSPSELDEALLTHGFVTSLKAESDGKWLLSIPSEKAGIWSPSPVSEGVLDQTLSVALYCVTNPKSDSPKIGL